MTATCFVHDGKIKCARNSKHAKDLLIDKMYLSSVSITKLKNEKEHVATRETAGEDYMCTPSGGKIACKSKKTGRIVARAEFLSVEMHSITMKE